MAIHWHELYYEPSHYGFVHQIFDYNQCFNTLS